MTHILRDVARTLRASPLFGFYLATTLAVALVIALITINVIDLGMDHFGEASHRTHDVAYGLLFTILVVGVLAQVRHPERNVAAMAMTMVPAAGLLLAGLLADQVDRVVEFNPLRYAAAVAAVATLLHPTGRTFFGSFRLARVSWPMLALVGAALVPLARLASTNLGRQRTVVDAHTFMGHYAFMAALGYTVIGVGLLASLRPIGWRLAAWTAGLIPVLLGGTSLLYPEATSSLDAAWAVVAAGWGSAFISVAARTPAPEGPPAPGSGDLPAGAPRVLGAQPTR